MKGVPSGEALGAIHALYRRHAEDVLRVLEDGAKKHAGELVRGAVPAGSILSVCAPGTRIEAPPPSDYDRQVREFMDALSEPRCEFAVDERRERIVFAGGFALTGANYSLVHALLGNFRAGKASGSEIAFMADGNHRMTCGKTVNRATANIMMKKYGATPITTSLSVFRRMT